MGNGAEGERVPLNLWFGVALTRSDDILHLVVWCRDDDGTDVALQGAYPSGLNLRAGVDVVLHDTHLLECYLDSRRGLRLFW